MDHATGQVAIWRLEEYRGDAWGAVAQARNAADLRR